MLAKLCHRARKLVRICTDTIRDMPVSGLKTTRRCPVCKSPVRIFWPYGVMLRPGAQCPRCGALERHRTLWLFFENHNLFDKPDMKLLHFAPEAAFLNQFKTLKNVDYWPVDLNPNMPGVRKAVDITDIPFEDESIDVIICNHVMEHIPDENRALSEMHRVLKQGGVAVVNAPVDYERETTFENPEYNTPELRLKHFGQHDHVRIYGRDYGERLAKVFKVEVLEPNRSLTAEQLKAYGVWEGDRVYLCRK